MLLRAHSPQVLNKVRVADQKEDAYPRAAARWRDDPDEFLTCFRLKTEKGEKANANHERHRTGGSAKCAEEPAT